MTLRKVGSNMTELTLPNAIVLFSYSTPVAAHIGAGFVRTNKKWSNTTSKHINKWLAGANAAEVEQEFLNQLVK